MKTEHWVFMGTMVGVIGTLALLGRRKEEPPRLGNPEKPYWDPKNPILKNILKNKKAKDAWKKKHLKVGEEAKYGGKTVKLDEPVRLPKGGKKKFLVYHQDANGKVKKIEWGDPHPDRTVKNHIYKNASSFWARHGCDGYFKRSKKDNKDAFDPSKKRFWTCYGPSLFAEKLALSSDKPW